jgi:hypothetical protein
MLLLNAFTLTTHAVLPGEVLVVDTASSKHWEGMAVVRALRGTIPLCVEVGEFHRNTELLLQ